MKTLQGFVQINALINPNNTGVISPLGQLSPLSRTSACSVVVTPQQIIAGISYKILSLGTKPHFSMYGASSNTVGLTFTATLTDPGSNTNTGTLLALGISGMEDIPSTNYPGSVEFTVFNSTDIITQAYVNPNNDAVQTAIDIAQQAILYSNVNASPLNASIWLSTFSANFSSKISNLQIGPFVTGLMGTPSLPSVISFTSLQDNLTNVTMWLSDQAFQNQYSNFLIVPTLPLANMDDFFNLSYQALANELSSLTPTMLMDNLQSQQYGLPPTTLGTDYYNYVPLNSNQSSISVPFWSNVYTMYGDNTGIIKAAIVSAILQSSTHTETEWSGIFPILFSQTEFLIIPKWKSISVPNLSVQSGLYSPVSNPLVDIAYYKSIIPSYNTPCFLANGVSQIDQYIQNVPSNYKYLDLMCVGGLNNSESIFQLTQLFPDYMPISTQDINFNRLNQTTQQFVVLLQQMLMYAEKLLGTYTLPSSMRTVTRDGRLYITSYLNNIEYLVLTLASA